MTPQCGKCGAPEDSTKHQMSCVKLKADEYPPAPASESREKVPGGVFLEAATTYKVTMGIGWKLNDTELEALNRAFKIVWSAAHSLANPGDDGGGR